jgi:large subunit ribosomal protein L13
MYTPNIDCGDNVIIINAEKIKLTGRKLVNKKFFWHTGYPGGIKERTAEATINGRFPERVIENAVRRMLDRNRPMGRQQLTKLYVYGGNEHPHAAQQPEVLDLAAMNPKNKREN